MKILVSGAGSIGLRHAENLKALGVETVLISDPNDEIKDKDFSSFEEALKESPEIVFICSPTKHHIPQALEAARSGAHLFIEKPLSYSMNNVNELSDLIKEKNLTAMVGCNMRFHHGPATVKKLIDENRIGEIQIASIYTGSYLPNWRPNQDYKKSYSADPNQGGVILDCIHEIDLALWYLGPAELKESSIESAKEIGLSDVDGTANLELEHRSGATSKVHLSFTEPEYNRNCTINGKTGVIKWDINEKKVDLFNLEGGLVQSYKEPIGFEFNHIYIEEVRHFLDTIEQKTVPFSSLCEAKEALKIAITARSTR
ncbi:MAG: Gfo/Idh/MocA family oxidoreductase [Kiritimatiellales bacterium]|nr:Gfo/Idh/MocA family oxidoreductase [Kiritimatiellales bacterium]